jgi:hypothetical protein
MSHLTDYLVFDIMGDLSFGKSFELKEPGKNQYRHMPHTIAEFMQFMYPVRNYNCRVYFDETKERRLVNLLFYGFGSGLNQEVWMNWSKEISQRISKSTTPL